MIEIVKYSHELKENWDSFLKEAKNFHFIFFRDYMEYHSDRFKDFSLLFYKKGKLIGILPANKEEDKLISHGGLTFGGIISGKRMTPTLMVKLFETLINFLKKNGFKFFIYKSIPYIYHSYPAQEDLYALFKFNGHLYKREITTTLDLKNKLGYFKGRKHSVKKAKKYGIVVSQSQNFDEFMELVKRRLKKKYSSKPVHTTKEIKYLASKFPDYIKLFTATLNNKMLGGIIIYETPSVAHNQYVGLSEEGEKLGAVDLIHDFLINNVYSNKRYYDFGTSNINEGKDINENLIRYKESFGGRGVVHDFYRIEIK